ncbi:unnamed protein product [Staurois parvus]|uniref:Uncharacterized protein n=1 Tax=Staurois parvus TaxID=386267 RepID=A0ABN9AYI3_9NEOB|nr:unnamed protein product [Staurois parvus]
MRVPDFKRYHRAVILARIFDWTHNSKSKHWVTIENTLSRKDLSRSIWVPPQFRELEESTSIYTRIVIREWDKMHSQRKWDFNSLLMPLRNSEFFPPGKEEITGRWIMKEDVQLREVMEGVNLRTLEDLKREEGKIFTRIDIWRYNQLKQFVEKLTKPLRTRKE